MSTTDVRQVDAIRAVLEKIDEPVRGIAIGFLNDLERERDRHRETLDEIASLCEVTDSNWPWSEGETRSRFTRIARWSRDVLSHPGSDA